MNPIHRLVWCPRKIAEALNIPDRDVREYMTDGRCVSFLVARRLARELPGWHRAQSRSERYDLTDPEGGLWEVRSVTRGSGVSFTPSIQVGGHREFEEEGFVEKVKGLTGYIVTDIERFPSMEVYKIPSDNVIRWWQANKLGKNSMVSRKRFLEILVPDIISPGGEGE